MFSPSPHILFSMKETGKAAIVVPTGFITAQTGIERKIRNYIIQNKILKSVVSMPSNIFATTGTNVSVLFLDKNPLNQDAILVDATQLGEKVKEGKTQKTILHKSEMNKIVDTVNKRIEETDFSKIVKYDDIANNNCSFSAGQYFDIDMSFEKITKEEFIERNNMFRAELKKHMGISNELAKSILKDIEEINYE